MLSSLGLTLKRQIGTPPIKTTNAIPYDKQIHPYHITQDRKTSISLREQVDIQN